MLLVKGFDMHELNEKIAKANFWCRVAEWTLAIVLPMDIFLVGFAIGECVARA